MGPGGFEPPTSRLSAARSYQAELWAHAIQEVALALDNLEIF